MFQVSQSAFVRALRYLVCLLAFLNAMPAADLVSSGSTWRYFKGVSEASAPDATAWRRADFDESKWLTGPATFWYGDVFTGTPITDMQNSYVTLFFRQKFNVTNPADLESLVLHAQCDDGFIVWLNGTEIQRYNVPDGELPYTATALTAETPDPAVFKDYAIANPQAVLKAGVNQLAVQVFNVNPGSSDIVWDASLAATFDQAAPVVANLQPPAGATVRELASIEVEFSEPVTGVEAADLLVNGVAATNVLAVSGSQYVFTFAKPVAGGVSAAFRTGHGITDLAGTRHPFAGLAWTYTLDPTLRLPGMEISEFLANNDKGLRDEDGDRGDWIELHSSAKQAQSLAGWSLTDDPANLTKWVFPSTSLAADRYLVVFASGKNRTALPGRLHTNFKLGNNGGYLALVSPGGEVVSDFGASYPLQRKDVSYGRSLGGGALTGYFEKPTPSAANSVSGVGFAPDVAFSRTSGTFLSDATVTLSLETPLDGATIRVTTDGTLPTQASGLYSGPITVTATTQVRARAFAPGLLPGSPRSETFIRLATSAASVRSDLPILVLHDFGQGRPPASTTVNAHFQLFEPVNGVTTLTNPPTLASRAGLGSRGSSTLGLDKLSLSLEFRDEFDTDKNHSLLGLPADSDWVLYAPNGFEPVLIHNPFMHQLSRDIGRYSPRTRFVEVYMATSGTSASISSASYYGIYVIEEKIKRGPDRVDVDAPTPGETRQPYISGGYLLKIDRGGPGEGGFFAANTGIIYVDPKERDMVLPDYAAQRQYLQSFMDSFGTALYGANWKDPVSGYAAYLNPDSWVDHHLLNIVSLNVDALRLSAYFYKPRSGRLEFGPLWDFDRALGSTDGRDANPRLWSGQVGAGTDFFGATTQAWWDRLFLDPDFYQRYIDRYQALRLTHFSTTNLWRLTDEMTTVVKKAQPRDYARWGGTLRTSTGNAGGSYSTEVLWMKRWLSNRVDFIDGQFVRPTALLTPGGRFTNSVDVLFRAPAVGTVYYTTDGTDPRLSGGGISPRATAATDVPVTLTANARVVARVYNPNHTAVTGTANPPLIAKWSGVVAETYFQAVPPLRITELMFHSADPAAGSTNTAADFEFVELKNVSAQTLNLTGFRLEGAVTYQFGSTSAVMTLKAGGRVLLVSNPTAFAARYPGTLGVAGAFTGNLSNGDERVRLFGPLGEPISDFSYQDSWAPLADGFGFSLVLANEAVEPDQLGESVAWRLSTDVGGSPGTADPDPRVFQPIQVNEALTHTDLPLLDTIELANDGSQPQDIGGWWLTDDYRTPKKFRIPAGTVLNPGAFALLDETQFRTGTNGNVGFSLNSLGDSVHLFSADAGGQLTGWHSGFDFGASFNGVSFGRHVTSDGRELFVAQTTRSLGAINSGPRVGPLVLTEIHFEPTPIAGTNNPVDEFIELRNIGAVPLPLYDPAHATNRWHLRGAVEFDFSTEVVLDSGALALVVGFDPAVDATQLAAFRAQFNPPASTPILGPWKGTLNNAGESLRVLAPDEPVPPPAANAGEVAYVLIDGVDYRPSTPWPDGAAGTGNSLQRISSRRFGNEPTNWRAAAPTAGRLNLPTDVLGEDSDGDGLPDAWEILYGLDPHSAIGRDGANGDPDQDGLTNAQEFAAGTAPTDAASVLRLEATYVGGIQLRFTGQPGRGYTLSSRDALEGADWKALATFPVQVGQGTLKFTEAAGASARFYRISTP